MFSLRVFGDYSAVYAPLPPRSKWPGQRSVTRERRSFEDAISVSVGKIVRKDTVLAISRLLQSRQRQPDDNVACTATGLPRPSFQSVLRQSLSTLVKPSCPTAKHHTQ